MKDVAYYKALYKRARIQTDCATDLQTLNVALSGISASNTALRSEILNLNVQINTLKGEKDTLQGSLNTANNQINTLKGQITTLNGQITTLNGQITTLKGEKDTLQGSLDNANTKINKLQLFPMNCDVHFILTASEMNLQLGKETSFDNQFMLGGFVYLVEIVPNTKNIMISYYSQGAFGETKKITLYTLFAKQNITEPIFRKNDGHAYLVFQKVAKISDISIASKILNELALYSSELYTLALKPITNFLTVFCLD